ncbi:hypothetical protein AS144_03895 [Francisella endosymbiont of Amblyomma maculatum]|nr:hypothetical protein AS144_03895 [Francisella endosymbiont of Amblyomma maculatum]
MDEKQRDYLDFQLKPMLIAYFIKKLKIFCKKILSKIPKDSLKFVIILTIIFSYTDKLSK